MSARDTESLHGAAPVTLTPGLLEAIASHGEQTFPDECCGILLGREHDGRRTVVSLQAIENTWDAQERSHRFLIQPADVLRAERTARAQGLDVLGFYHTHPDSPARPSEFDREYAWPWYTYLIASIRSGRFETLAGWQLRDDRTAYDEVDVVSMSP